MVRRLATEFAFAVGISAVLFAIIALAGGFSLGIRAFGWSLVGGLAGAVVRATATVVRKRRDN